MRALAESVQKRQYKTETEHWLATYVLWLLKDRSTANPPLVDTPGTTLETEPGGLGE